MFIDMQCDLRLGCLATSRLTLDTADSVFSTLTIRRTTGGCLLGLIVCGSEQGLWSSEVARRVRRPRTIDYVSLTRRLLRRFVWPLILLCTLLYSDRLWARPLAFANNSEPATQESRLPTLQLGRRVRGSVADKQRYGYRLPLSEGQFIQLALTTINSNVVLTLSSPRGEKLIDLNTSDGPGGTRPVFWITQEPGDYAIAIVSADETASMGTYGLELQEKRTPVANDKALLEAQTAFLEGEALRRTENGKSLEAAVSILQHAAERWKTAGEPIQEAQALTQLGLVYGNLGKNNEAIEPLKLAISLARQGQAVPQEAAALHNIGEVYYNLGDKRKALSFYNQALSLRHFFPAAQQESDTLNDIGVVYDDMGQSQSALIYYERALRLKHETGERTSEAVILSNLGIVYDNLGDSTSALDYYKSAVAVQHLLGSKREEGITLNNMGSAYHHMGDEQDALEYYGQALRLLQQVHARLEEGKTLSNIARSYAMLGKNQEALDYFTRALPIREEVGDRRGQAYTLSYMGDTYLKLGERDKAREYFDRALLLAQQASAPSIESTTRYGMARLDLDLGDRTAAQVQIEKALAIIEELRSEVQIRGLRSSYLATVQPVYEFYIDLLMSLDQQHPGEGYSAKALETAERARARSLLEMLVEAQIDIRSGVDPQLLQRERNLQKRINEKSEQAFHLQSQKGAPQDLEVARRELEALTLEREAVQGEVRLSSAKYAALPQPQPIDVAEIQRLLDPETALLEFSLGDTRSFLWVVTQKSFFTFELPPRSLIESPARQLYRLLTRRNRSATNSTAAPLPADEAALPFLRTELGRLLFGPVTGFATVKRLVIVSDGALQYIPFGVLPAPEFSGVAPDSAKSTSLIDKYEIINLPSASILTVLGHEKPGISTSAKVVAVLADPVFDAADQRISRAAKGHTSKAWGHTASVFSLGSAEGRLTRSASDVGLAKDTLQLARLPFSRQEADSIVAMSPAGSSLEALDFKASRATATSPELSEYRIVHFATHGLLDSEHPEFSGLVFSLVDPSGRPQNGFLELQDIYNLKLHADLVVLSACETGLGKEIKGEGLVGLTRGFMYAGAPRVVASLWKVDDVATAELMAQFYKYVLQQKLSPAAALRAAQLDISHQRRWADPYYWAGFTIQGEWR